MAFKVLFEEIEREDPQQNISACYIIRKLNQIFSEDEGIVNLVHANTLLNLGITHNICNGEFLMCIVDLLNSHGIQVIGL